MINYMVLASTSNPMNTTWKVVLVIIAIVLFIFVIFGLIGMLVKYILKKQARAVDKDMGKLVISRVCDNPKDFKRFASIKSMDRFFKASIVPIILLIIALILYLVYGFKYNRRNESLLSRETGIASLFYILDFSSVEYYPPLGTNFSSWVFIPPSVFQDERIFNYFIFLFTSTGLIYYLVVVGAYLARKYRIHKKSKELYSANLDKMDLSSFYSKSLSEPTKNDNKESID